MKLLFAGVLAAGLVAAPAAAELAVGAGAPDFTAEGAIGGKHFTFNLNEALKKGPVVLYFYPKSFTKGCTLEAHDFAEASEKFASYGATVVGVSHDDLATQEKFSSEECRNKFAVLADPDGKVIAQFDTKLGILPMSNRVSYVITPDHKIAHSYTAMDYTKHVSETMGAVQKWKAAHP